MRHISPYNKEDKGFSDQETISPNQAYFAAECKGWGKGAHIFKKYVPLASSSEINKATSPFLSQQFTNKIVQGFIKSLTSGALSTLVHLQQPHGRSWQFLQGQFFAGVSINSHNFPIITP